MVNKYCKDLENRNINPSTDEIWNIDDVPKLWNKKVRKQLEIDGYKVADDGTVVPIVE